MGRLWSAQETEFLRGNYATRPSKEIAKRLGRTRSSVWHKAGRLRLLKRPHVLEPKLAPSPALSYVMGVLLGDGWVSKDKKKRCRIHLEVKDGAFAHSFANSLSEINLNPTVWFNRNRRHGRWFVQGYSKKFYEWFHSLIMKDIHALLVDKRYKKEFIRGLYEAEGSYRFRPNRNNRLEVRLFNTKLELLSLCKACLECLGFKISLQHSRSTSCYTLNLLGGDSQTYRFFRIIKPAIKNPFGPESKTGAPEEAKELVKAIEASKDGKLEFGAYEYTLSKDRIFIQRTPVKKK